ncbi:MAG: hypothetical protein ACPGES_13835 [Coraliomargarita sp.]
MPLRTIYTYKKRVEFGATVRWLNEYDLDNSYVSGAVNRGIPLQVRRKHSQ